MSKTFYAILTTDHLHNCNVALSDLAFKTKKEAEWYIKELADMYIMFSKTQKKNSKKHYQFHSNTIFGGPSENCQFAEIAYTIQKVKVE